MTDTLADRLPAAAQAAYMAGDYGHRDTILEAIAALRAQQWVSVEDRLPPAGKTVWVHYLNQLGKHRTVRAAWVPQYSEEANSSHDDIGSEYCEEKDAFYWPEGWYEQIDNWDDYSAVFIYGGTIDSWMPLPALPEQQESPE